MKLFQYCLSFLLLVLFFSNVWSVPNAINYQGRLLDSNGIPITQNGVAMKATLWDHETSVLLANKLYEETHTVNVDDGVYNFKIGEGSPVYGSYGPTLFDGAAEVWLELEVESETLSPRTEMLSAPYTLQSQNTQTLDNLAASFFASDADLSTLVSQLASFCATIGGTWNPSTGCEDLVKIPKTLQVISLNIAGNGPFIPVERSGLVYSQPHGGAFPPHCLLPHFHGTNVTDCNGAAQPDLDPTQCGYGTVMDIAVIPYSECSNPP